MDQAQATRMQLQLRHNAEDLQSYLRDLESWETEIKKKDDSLLRHKPILKEVMINSGGGGGGGGAGIPGDRDQEVPEVGGGVKGKAREGLAQVISIHDGTTRLCIFV